MELSKEGKNFKAIYKVILKCATAWRRVFLAVVGQKYLLLLVRVALCWKWWFQALFQEVDPSSPSFCQEVLGLPNPTAFTSTTLSPKLSER